MHAFIFMENWLLNTHLHTTGMRGKTSRRSKRQSKGGERNKTLKDIRESYVLWVTGGQIQDQERPIHVMIKKFKN